MPLQTSSPNHPSSNTSAWHKSPGSTLSLRIRFENAMRSGMTLKQLKDAFPDVDPKNIAQRITTMGYQKHYLTNEEHKHILARRKIQNETPAQ
jgi:hypothetical protein